MSECLFEATGNHHSNRTKTKMANRLKFIGQASTTTLGADLIANVNGIDDSAFVCETLHIRHEVVLSAGTGNLDNTNVGQAQHELLWRKTNRPFLNNITGAAADLYAKAQSQPALANSFNVFAQQAISTGNTHVFDIAVPLKRIQSARPADYCVALDEIGTLTVQLPASLANVTGGALTSWTVRFYCSGYDATPGKYKAGVLARIDELTGPSGNDVELKCYGNKVRSLIEYTTDPAGSPIGGESAPRIEFDSVLKYDFRSLTGGDAAYYAGNGFGNGQAYTTYYQAGATSTVNALSAPWIVPNPTQKLSGLHQVNVMQIRYNSRLADTTEARFILETVYPDNSGSKLRERVPGAANVANPDAIAYRPGTNGSASAASAADKAFMPVDFAV